MTAITLDTRTRSAFWELFLIEMKLFLREPFAVFFTLVFPVLVLCIFSSVFGEEPTGYNDFLVADMLVPSAIATIIGYLGLMGVPIALAEYREMGVLRRFKASPLGLPTFMAAHMAVQFTFLVVASALSVATSAILFGTRFRGNLVAFITIATVSAVATFAVGFLLVGLTKGARTAQSMGAGLFFPMLFVSGATIPRDDFPNWLHRVSDYVPMSKVVDNLASSWIGVPFVSDNWLALMYLTVLAAVLALTAGRWFRWD